MDPLKIAVLALAPTLAGYPLLATDPALGRANRAYDAALEACKLEHPKATDPEHRVCAKRIWGKAFFESSWTPGAIGDCIDPKVRTVTTCKAFGIMQVWNPEKSPVEITRKAILEDTSGVTGFRAGLRVLDFAIAKCGSVASGFGFYATGKVCGGAAALVRRECKMMGDAECLAGFAP